MKTMILVLMLMLLSMNLSGCASFQTPSVYSNQSTADQNVINAQGAAADYAAMANITYNCPSCTDQQKEQLMRYMILKYQSEQDAAKVLDKNAQSHMADTINWRLDRALDQALFYLLQDY